MGANTFAPPAPAHRPEPLTIASYDECLAASGVDPFVRWQVDPRQSPEGWVLDGAVAFLRLAPGGRRTLTVIGPPAAAAVAVRRLVRAGEPTRVTVPAGTLELMSAELRVGDGASWEWMRTDVPPASFAAAQQVQLLRPADDLAISELLRVASPRHSSDPGDEDIVQWVGVRDGAGTLSACAAHTESGSGVPHLASIATHLSAQGRGLGSLVTGTLTRRLLLAGAPVVTLGMYSDNDIARRMYLRLGFRCDHRWSSYVIIRRPPR